MKSEKLLVSFSGGETSAITPPKTITKTITEKIPTDFHQ